MFGIKRLLKDMGDALNESNSFSEEERANKLYKSFDRFAGTNFIAGCLTITTGAVAGLIGLEVHKKIKKKKKIKELLEGSDK